MEIKKSEEADLEKKRSSFLWIGVVFALGLVLTAFEYTLFDKTESEMGTLVLDMVEEEIIPVSIVTPPPPPPPPAPTTVIEIVDDEEEIEEVDLTVEEVDESTEIEIVEIVEEVEEEEIFTIVEEMPSFPGGEGELFKYLGKNIEYPQMAADAGIQGVVYVTFVVDKDGKVKDAKVLKGINGGCNEEALRVIKNMPKWKPGKQRGKAVQVQYNLPVRFVLK